MMTKKRLDIENNNFFFGVLARTPKRKITMTKVIEFSLLNNEQRKKNY